MPTKKAAPTKGPRESRWKKYDYAASRWSGDFASADENKFALPQDVVDNLAREGIALQWHVESVLGQQQDSALAVAQKNGWEYVEENELPGVPVTKHGGMVLMARSMAIHEKAEARDKANSTGAITRMRAKHGEGDLPGINPEAARHPSARRSNKHNRTIERLDIPTYDD